MDTPNTYKLLQTVLSKLYDLEERVERLEKQEPRLFASEGDELDPLYLRAKRIVVTNGQATASLLQKKLKIGYARAARYLDLMEAEGIIGPADGAKPRDILI